MDMATSSKSATVTLKNLGVIEASALGTSLRTGRGKGKLEVEQALL